MKTILVPVFGSDIDQEVLEAGHALAFPFKSHLECLHVRPDPAQIIAGTTVGIETGLSAGVLSAEIWEEVIAANAKIAKAAHLHFKQYVERNAIRIEDKPNAISSISAVWREEEGDFSRIVIRSARANDVLVLGRPNPGEILPEAPSILSGCGRPILLAPRKMPSNLASTIVIAWKETAEAARAVTASMPLLERSAKVIVVSASEDDDATRAERSASRLAENLSWHGLNVSAHHVPLDRLSPAEAVLAVAGEMGATLMVMGGYGHSRAYEFMFGGFTRHALARADLPVLMAH